MRRSSCDAAPGGSEGWPALGRWRGGERRRGNFSVVFDPRVKTWETFLKKKREMDFCLALATESEIWCWLGWGIPQQRSYSPLGRRPGAQGPAELFGRQVS